MSGRLDAACVLVRGAALADGRSPRLRGPVSVLVRDGVVAGLWEGEPPEDDAAAAGAVVVDATGSALVPGLVDLHGHLALEGGGRYRDRLLDPTGAMVAVAEENGARMVAAGVRWVRDAGASTRSLDGEPERPLNVTLRDRWRGRRDRPAVIAAGTWIFCPGYLPAGVGVEAADGRDLVPLALAQLDAGADWVKLYLQGPTPEACPWTAAAVREVVAAVHDRGARVMAHAVTLAGAAVAAAGGVDTLDHGFQLDAATVEAMAANDVALVTTLSVPRAKIDHARNAPWHGLFDVDAEQRALEAAQASARLARDGGVTVVAGSDQGGGTIHAGQLASELELLVEAGFAPADALAAVTWRAGDALGLPEAGRIRVGDPATFLLVDGDPSSDPRALWRVWLTA